MTPSPLIRRFPQNAQGRDLAVGDIHGHFALLQQALDNVNELQGSANDLRTRFDMGDKSVDLSEVMIAGQKSSIAFEATVQVRNKMVDAYKTIMNMPV